MVPLEIWIASSLSSSKYRIRPAACWIFGPFDFLSFLTAMRVADLPFVFQDAEYIKLVK